MTLHFLYDVANDAESIQNIENYVIISETMGKLINKIPVPRLLIKFTRLGFENAC